MASKNPSKSGSHGEDGPSSKSSLVSEFQMTKAKNEDDGGERGELATTIFWIYYYVLFLFCRVSLSEY